MSATQRLLGKARLRLRAANFGRNVRYSGLAVAVICLLGLLASRLLALLPSHWFTPSTLGIAGGLAVLSACLLTRRPEAAATARRVDASAGTKELFLTASLITDAPGAYQPVVLEQADAKATQLDARRLLPFHWQRGTRDLLLAAAVVAAAYLWLPQLDPFRMDEQRQETAKQAKRLEELQKITIARKAEIQEKTPALSEQVNVALAKLDKTLKETKPEQKQENAKKLNEEAQDFSNLWKKLSEQLPQKTAERMEQAAQSFGDTKDRQALKEAIEQLKQGNAQPLKDALEKMQKEMQEVAKQGAGPDQKQALEKLAREMAKTAEQLRQQLGDKALSDALQRALEQMDLSQLKDLAKNGLEGANQSMELSQKELERLGEMFKDMQQVQDALKNLQAAKQLNEKGGLDGKDAQGAGAESQGDYKKLFEKLMAERGGGSGEGEDGEGEGEGDGQGKGKGKGKRGKSGNAPGVGDGGTVGEDPNAKTALKDEKSKSQLGAGKLLMQWKDEGVGEIGARSGDYQAAVRAVKEGAAEAIRNEQVPPGYHSAIQKYFDRLPAEPPKK